jgi:hypothetical protein
MKNVSADDAMFTNCKLKQSIIHLPYYGEYKTQWCIIRSPLFGLKISEKRHFWCIIRIKNLDQALVRTLNFVVIFDKHLFIKHEFSKGKKNLQSS